MMQLTFKYPEEIKLFVMMAFSTSTNFHHKDLNFVQPLVKCKS